MSQQALQPPQLSLVGLQFIQQVANNTAGFPTVRSVGVYGQVGGGPLALGYSYDSNSGGKGYVTGRPIPEHVADNIAPFSLSIKADTSGDYSGGATVRDPYTGLGAGVSIKDNGAPTVGLSGRRGPVTVGATATLGTIGNPKCQSHP